MGSAPSRKSGSVPGVSYVMPVLNEAGYLEAAVTSILNQDYPGEVELVLALGPSTDGTAAIIDGIDLRLQSAEILGIYGESGAGKTVLSRALANWLPESLSYRGGSVAF